MAHLSELELLQKDQFTHEVQILLTKTSDASSKHERKVIVRELFKYINDIKKTQEFLSKPYMSKFLDSCCMKLDEFHKENEQDLLMNIQLEDGFFYNTKCLHFTKQGTLCKRSQHKNGFCKQHFKIICKNKQLLELKKLTTYKLDLPFDIVENIISYLHI